MVYAAKSGQQNSKAFHKFKKRHNRLLWKVITFNYIHLKLLLEITDKNIRECITHVSIISCSHKLDHFMHKKEHCDANLTVDWARFQSMVIFS